MRENAQSILALDDAVMVELIERNVSIKAKVVMEDEKEHGVRAHLNFGHTFAHAIEATAGYGEILHGEAVALGMLAATRASVEAGLCEEGLLDSLEVLLDAFGLATSSDLPENAILEEAMRHDKKVIDDRIRLILPEALGRITIRDDLSPVCVRSGWDHIRQH